MQVDPSFPPRFVHHLPFASRLVLSPGLAFAACALAGLLASVFSIHYGLSFLIFWTALFAFYLDRGLLERVLIPPFGLIIAWEAIALGLGIGLIVYASGHKFEPNLMKMQVAHLLLFPVMCAAYRIGFGKAPRMVFPENIPAFEQQVVRPLFFLGWGFLLWRVLQITVFAATGAEDRGEFSIVATDQYFGLWTYFNLFPRFNSLGFFLLPLVFSRCAGPMRVILLGIVAYYFLLAFATGARGNVFFPILFIGIGAFFFRIVRMIKLDLLGAAVVVATLPLLILMDHFRNTDAYRATRTIDLRDRLAAVSEARVRSGDTKEKSEDKENILILGRALVGVMDSTVYEMTPSVLPHVGRQNFRAVAYTWVPFFLFRDRPILYDANLILIDYTGGYYTRTGKAISLTADLYRRFGWLGVPFGIAAGFALYGFFARHCYRVYFTKDALLGILLILFLFSYFQARPFSTVLTTWWLFFYEAPKHLILLFGLYWLSKRIYGIGEVSGALAFEGPWQKVKQGLWPRGVRSQTRSHQKNASLS
jgi:hypothetical protein